MAKRKEYDSAKKILSDLGSEACAAAREALSRCAHIVYEVARENCPVYQGTDKRVVKGALRDSIYMHLHNRDGSLWSIGADAESEDGVFYGRLVEFSPRINKPFLYPAFDANKDAIVSAIVGAVCAAIRRRGK